VASKLVWNWHQTRNTTFLLESYERRCEACQLILLSSEYHRIDVAGKMGGKQPGIHDVYGAMCDLTFLEQLSKKEKYMKYKNGFEIGTSSSEQNEFLQRTVELCKQIPFDSHDTVNFAHNAKIMHNTDKRLAAIVKAIVENLQREAQWYNDRYSLHGKAKVADAWQVFERLLIPQLCSSICSSRQQLKTAMFDFDYMKKRKNQDADYLGRWNKQIKAWDTQIEKQKEKAMEEAKKELEQAPAALSP